MVAVAAANRDDRDVRLEPGAVAALGLEGDRLAARPVARLTPDDRVDRARVSPFASGTASVVASSSPLISDAAQPKRSSAAADHEFTLPSASSERYSPRRKRAMTSLVLLKLLVADAQGGVREIGGLVVTFVLV